MKLYTYEKCGTCRKAVKWLEARNSRVEAIPIRERPPTVGELKKMLGFLKGDLRRLFNTSGQDYRVLNLREKLPQMSEAEALKLLASNGNLVKRPFLLTDQGGTTGFQEEEWRSLLGG